MDPDALLTTLREKVRASHTQDMTTEQIVDHLWSISTLFDDLDEWLSNGGMVPVAWGSIRMGEPIEPWHGKATE